MSGGVPETTLPDLGHVPVPPFEPPVMAVPGAEASTVVAPPLDRPRLSRHRRGFWRDVLEMVALIVVIYTFVNLTTARAIVEGPSMQPNFYTGQLIIVNLFAYYFAPPARGDVIVLHNPSPDCKSVIEQNASILILLPNNASTGCDDLIKRVIGLPGETVDIKGGRVSINGVQLDEPYIAHFCDRGCDGTWTLKPNQYFILGDNRANSYDSHAFGPIDRSLIVGQAWIRYWPLPEFMAIPHPSYGVIPATPLKTPAPTTPDSRQIGNAVE